MAIQECTEQALLRSLVPEAGSEAVFVYTAMCGTCQLAERMLGIVQEAGITVPIRKLNINYAPVLRKEWRIASVPCLVLLRGGEPVHMEYAMKAVDYLYTRLKTFQAQGGS